MVCEFAIIIVIVISFTSMALEDVHEKLGLYKVLTCSQGKCQVWWKDNTQDDTNMECSQ